MRLQKLVIRRFSSASTEIIQLIAIRKLLLLFVINIKLNLVKKTSKKLLVYSKKYQKFLLN